MNSKLKRFFIEKKELLIFAFVLLLVFATVITVTSIALNGSTPVGGDIEPTTTSTVIPSSSASTPSSSKTATQTTEVKTINMPVHGDYIVVRTFFDASLTKEELSKAVINNGSYFQESYGISYSKEDNSVFDVYSIYAGRITDITTDELEGTVVTITHENNMVSVYSALSEICVSLNELVTEDTLIGKAGTTLLDSDAKVHVHLEILIDDEFINPTLVFGKKTSEVSSLK